MFNSNETKDKLIKWIQTYFKENGSYNTKAVVGMSGGKDSTIVAKLCVEALGKDRVIGVLMPDGNKKDYDLTLEICKALNIKIITMDIKDIRTEMLNALRNQLSISEQAKINIPPRIRTSLLYGIASSVGGRVANTSNYSEKYVGYCTKFGDNVGDFSPLGNLTCLQVIEIGKALGLDDKYILKTPEDGLSGKTDEENLGFTYQDLENHLSNNLKNQEVETLIKEKHQLALHKINSMPTFKD